MTLLWERIRDESLAHHPSTRAYMEMFAKYNGWDKPESKEFDRDIIVKIGDTSEP